MDEHEQMSPMHLVRGLAWAAVIWGVIVDVALVVVTVL